MFKHNDKVIVKSSDIESYKIGRFIEDSDLSNCQGDIPVVKFAGDEERYMCFGIVLPYSKEMARRLDNIKNRQQFKFLTAIKDWENDKHFIIMRGLPGSGKSTKAKLLAGDKGKVFSADDYHMKNGNYDWKPENVGKAHSWNQKQALDAFETDVPIIIIDNTNTTLREMRAYLPHIEQAMLRGYQVSIEEPDTEWAFNVEECFNKGTHNVPKDTLEKMNNRYVHNTNVEHIMFY